MLSPCHLGESCYSVVIVCTFISLFPAQVNTRAVIASPRFWPAGCGCFYLDFYYYAYGADVDRLEVGYDNSTLLRCGARVITVVRPIVILVYLPLNNS